MTTAVKAPAISTVNTTGSRPMIGAIRTPASPASRPPNAHTATSTACGLVPTRRVIGSESTSARTVRPALVYRRISRPASIRKRTEASTMIWSRVIVTRAIWKTLTGRGAKPGTVWIG